MEGLLNISSIAGMICLSEVCTATGAHARLETGIGTEAGTATGAVMAGTAMRGSLLQASHAGPPCTLQLVLRPVSQCLHPWYAAF